MIRRLLDRLAAGPSVAGFVWVVALALLTAYSVDQRMRERKPPPHPYVTASKAIQARLFDAPEKSGNHLFILFIDSFRFDYALDPALMPRLNRMIPESTWGMVKPCTSNMTVHCVETTFSGYDGSSLLSFAEDFHPKQSTDASAWPFLMARMGYRIKVICNYVIARLYKDALADVHFYERGQEGIDAGSLADLALKWFSEPDTDVTLLYVIDSHDAGHKFGTTGPEYKKALRDADAVLGRVLDAARPTDTILVYGDHGINDLGQHNYSQDVPTLYAYRGPDFLENHRQDISMFSHRFFLNVLFRLPFSDSYQGETYFDALTPEAKAAYGGDALLALKRSDSGAVSTTRWTDWAFAAGLLLAGMAGLAALGRRPRRPGLAAALGGAVAGAVAVALGQAWLMPLALALAAAGIWEIRLQRPGGPVAAGAALLVGIAALLVVRAVGYTAFDRVFHGARLVVWFALYAAYFAAGWFLAVPALGLPRTVRARVLSGGAVLSAGLFLLHYPTLYGFGALRGVTVALTVLFIGWGVTAMSGTRGLRRIAGLAGTVLAAGFLGSQYLVFVENFRIVHFTVFPPESTGPAVQGLALAAMVAAQAAAAWTLGVESAGRRARWLALGGSALVVLVAARVIPVPGIAQAVVSLAAVVLLAAGSFVRIRFLPRFALFLLLQAVTAFVYEFGFPVLFQLNAAVACAAVLYAGFKTSGAAERPAALVTVVLVSLYLGMAAFGMRVIGIDFRFASRWFGDAYVALWYFVFLATLMKYAAPLLLVMLVAGGRTPQSLAPGAGFYCAVLMLLAPFAAVLLAVGPAATLVVDSLEELIFTTAMLLVYALAAAAAGRYRAA
jgi:hypothetical protein